jgi:S1-C subfamily serine protease
VIATTADGPAQHAGIKDGDVIVAIDGKTVTNADDLASILAGSSPVRASAWTSSPTRADADPSM